MSKNSKNQSKENDFARQADESPPGLFMEFWDFITNNKKWWLTPIIIMLMLLAGLMILGGSAPFIYTLF